MVTSPAEPSIVEPENQNHMHYLQLYRLCEWRLIYIGDIVHDPLFGCVRDPLYLGLCVNYLDSYKNRKYYLKKTSQFIKAVNGVVTRRKQQIFS